MQLFKHKDGIIVVLFLLIGIIGGLIFNLIINLNGRDNNYKSNIQVSSNNLGNGVECFLTNNNGEKIKSLDQLRLEDNKIKIKININNYVKGIGIKYECMVLINSKQIKLNTNTETGIEHMDIISEKYGENIFNIEISNMEEKPKEMTIILFNKYKNKQNICFSLCEKISEKEIYEMNKLKSEGISRGIYFNAVYKNNNITSENTLFLDKSSTIDIPVLFKNYEKNKQFKIFLFEEHNQRKINDKDYIYVDCNDTELKESKINIKAISKKENNYILVAVPINSNNQEAYFSNRVKVIVE